MNTFSKRFQQLRVEAGLTQSQIAKVLNTTQRRISYLESGKVEPDLNTLIFISKHFEVSTDYLLGLKEY